MYLNHYLYRYKMILVWTPGMWALITNEDDAVWKHLWNPPHVNRLWILQIVLYKMILVTDLFQAQSDDDDADDVAVTVDSSGFMDEFFEQVTSISLFSPLFVSLFEFSVPPPPPSLALSVAVLSPGTSL